MANAYQSLYVQTRGVLRKELTAYLRTGRTRRRSPRRRPGEGRLKDMVSISERPAEAADRAVPGQWEGDLVLGRLGRSANRRPRRAPQPLRAPHGPPRRTNGPIRAPSAGRANGHAAGPAEALRSPGTRARGWPSTSASAARTACPSTSAIPAAPSSAGPARTPTACSANTSRRAPISPPTRRLTSTRRSNRRVVEKVSASRAGVVSLLSPTR